MSLRRLLLSQQDAGGGVPLGQSHGSPRSRSTGWVRALGTSSSVRGGQRGERSWKDTEERAPAGLRDKEAGGEISLPEAPPRGRAAQWFGCYSGMPALPQRPWGTSSESFRSVPQFPICINSTALLSDTAGLQSTEPPSRCSDRKRSLGTDILLP